MPEINQDLKLQSDPTTIVRPNINSDNIPSGAVTEAKLATGAVTQGKLASGAVGNAQLATQAVSADKIAPNAVTHAKMADDSVDTNNLVNQSVTSNKIATGAVSASKLKWSYWNFPGFASDLGVPMGTLADLAKFIKDVHLARYGFLTSFFYMPDPNGSEICPVFFEVDNSNMVTYRLSSDYNNAIDLTSDADVLTFLAGQGLDIYIAMIY